MSIITCHLGFVVELLCPWLHNIILLLMGSIQIGISLLPPNMQKNIFKEEEDGFHPTPKKNSNTYFRANCITLYNKIVDSNKKQ